MTVWRTIPSYPQYEVSDDGRVRRRETQRELKLNRHRSGYMMAKMWIDGKQRNGYVQRLLCEAFHGPAPAPKMHAAHGNGIKSDNRPDNLSWKTKTENEHDKRAHGKANIGSRNGKAVLDETVIPIIRRRAAELPRSSGGKRIKKGALGKLAGEFGVTAACLRNILSGNQWRHVP